MTKFISQVGQEKNKEQKQFDLFPWSRLHALYRLTLILYSKKKTEQKSNTSENSFQHSYATKNFTARQTLKSL